MNAVFSVLLRMRNALKKGVTATVKKRFCFLLIIALFISVCVTAGTADTVEIVPDYTAAISEEPEFKAICLAGSVDDFNSAGFQFGDSCDIRFSNGYTLEDVPYYNGYYARTNEPLLVAYPGYEHVEIAICNGDSSWLVCGCSEGDTVTVTLAQAGKYLAVQEAMNTVYSNERADYPDDKAFANFRVMSGGRLRKNTFFRGASPVNNTYNRAGIVDRLIRETGIAFVLDLADNGERLKQYAEESNSEYFLSLYHSGRVAPLGLNASYRSDTFRKTLAAGLLEMMNHEGPYYIHCTEGKDRTGFVCLLLEALSGAGPDELEADYMLTFKNYYGILSGSERYDTFLCFRFHDMYDWLAGLGGGDPEAGARAYLLDGGMTETEVDELERFLTE